MNRLLVISSVSGGGKTTVISRLCQRWPQLQAAITATSRAPRRGEVNGVHYYFLALDEFKKRIDDGLFIEHAEVHGNYYGVPADYLKEQMEQGKTVVLNIDIQGMRTIKQLLGEEALTIFLLPPDEKVWEERLRARGTDSESVIEKRLAEGRRELAASSEFDYEIVNDDLGRTMSEVESILVVEGMLSGSPFSG